MIIGFSKHGRGSGDRAVSYLTDGIAPAVGYLAGQSRKGVERDPAPVVLRGDPRITQRLMQQVPFERRYVSGVLSFSEDRIAPQTERTIMDRFEETAFAGLDKDRFNILWIRHSHKGRHEMHFLTPAIELQSGKNLNINPPRKSSRQTFDILRRLLNDEFNLSDPDDPARARALRVPSYAPKGTNGRDNLRAAIVSFLETKLRAGVVKTRDEALQALRAAGYTFSRASEKYVTVLDKAGNRCRLKGSLFKSSVTPVAHREPSNNLSPDERDHLQNQLTRLVAARAEYNRKRFGLASTETADAATISPMIPELNVISSHDRAGKFAACRLGTLDERIGRPRNTIGATIERVGGATCRFRETLSKLGDRIGDARRARERLDQATDSFGKRTAATVRYFKEQKMTSALFAKYHVADGRRQEEKEPEMEMEPERCGVF